MAQPSGQVALDTGHAFYGHFWYANDTGLWDARNSVMATKTGSGSVTATGSGGENVANGDGSTYYTMASAITLTAPWTISFKVERASSTGDAGMVIGNGDSTNANYFWLRSSEVRPFSQTVSNSGPDSWAVFTYVKNSNGTGALYKNGSLVTTLAFASSGTVSHILTGYTGTTYAFNGALEYLHIIPGLAANSTQVSSLYSDPYQALQAGGTSTTLTLDTGSYSLTGTSVLFNKNVNSVLDTGSYTVTGQDASLIIEGSYTLSLYSGVYTLTSSTPNVGIGTLLESGTYTMTGKNVRLVSSTEPVVFQQGPATISISIKIGI